MEMSIQYTGPERRGVAWLSVARVAQRFGYSEQYIRGLVRAEEILGRKGKRAWRLCPVSVREWWARRTARN